MNSALPQSLTLFCKVVDNYGDIGICWRLAKQLKYEHQLDITLCVDDLISFKRICPQIIDTDIQQVEQITIRHWRDQNGVFAVKDISDIVIEFFGCELPPSYLTAMAAKPQKPVWINLEGLSAEQWVEGCHTLPSPHPTLSLTKYFFFPGFTNKTGGLLLESGLIQQRRQFQQNLSVVAAFLGQLGVTTKEMLATKVSLFCYPNAPVQELFQAWENSDSPVTCLVPEGVATQSIEAFLGHAAQAGTSITRGALTVHVIPFLPQADYDKLLWACDLNFVRGEDSFVRAQWAGRPFIWHIYPQDKNLHHVKFNAFLDRLTAKTESLVEFSLAWNAVTADADFVSLWRLFKDDCPSIEKMSADWQDLLIANGDLASNLMKFAQIRYNT